MKILFIGNSYTFYNDMPKMLAELGVENGKELEVDSVTRGGRKLYENLVSGDEYNSKILELIAKKSYDVLILQEQSYFALVDYAEFERGVRGLVELVGAKRVILYATWGRKAGCDLLPKYGWSSAEMGEKLFAAYSSAAKACGAEVSPVGLCFNKINAIGDFELYHPDLSHPSRLGTVIGVLCHYKKIFGELPEKCETLALSAEEKRVVFDTVDNT
ncbi:MAG: hypothetical protein IJW52_03210 [Clostridia bacterium]|nr:hypothetical protein [Clostridia bacterium]